MKPNPEHEKFGRGISLGFIDGYSRWFNQEPDIHISLDGDKMWPCPIEGCIGEMKYNGGAWPMSPMGYHHTCDKCGFTAALRGKKYPQ